jgi:hypothetical protein
MILTPVASGASLSRIWASRYLPDLSVVLSNDSNYSITHLLESLSEQGRRKTVDKMRRHLRISCELAGLEVHQLFSGSSELVNLAKVRQLAKSVEQVYETILWFYEQRSLNQQNPTEDWVPVVEALSLELQPVLSQMQAQHLADQDPRTIGFVTTQFHFSTHAILQRLNPIERVLMNSYFQIVEEQVCIPWQEICALAMRYDRTSPEIFLLEQLLPESDAIAWSVCEKARKQFPQFRSQRGGWENDRIITSMMRDLNMFQGYLLLCTLHKDLSPLTVRLLPMCLMVFPTVNVSWDFIDQTIRLLVEEIRESMTEQQWSIVQPYAIGLIHTFANQNK